MSRGSRRHRAITRRSPDPPQPAPNGQRSPEVRQMIAAQMTSFSGPMPPPEMLAHYDQILPGAAERIFQAVEVQGRHRQQLEARVVSNGVLMERAGMACALVVSLSGIALAAWLGSRPGDLAAPSAAAVVIAEVAGLAGVFIYGRRKEGAELARKWSRER